MTSEGQHAGQPAEATSGEPTSGGFPTDPDAQRIAGRASAQPPAEGFPNSYGPPPTTAPGGGSPFVVPAVATFGAGSGQGGTSYGSARVPQPEASPYGSVSPEAAGAASPYGSSPGQYGQPGTPPAPYGSAPAGPVPASAASAPVPAPTPFGAGPPQSSWTAPGAAIPPPVTGHGAPTSFGAPSFPPPVTDLGAPTSFDAPGFPPPAPPESPGERLTPSGLPSRTPGATAPEDGGLGRSFSAFGDQPVRVPGASLAGLPDSTAPASFSTAPAQNGWMQNVHTPENPADAGSPAPATSNTVPSRRGEGGGFPLRAPAGPGTDSPSDSQPSLDLPVRGQQPFGNTSPEQAREPFGSNGSFPPAGPASEPLGGSGFPPSAEAPSFTGGGFPPPEAPPFSSPPVDAPHAPLGGGSFPPSGEAPAFGGALPASGATPAYGGSFPPAGETPGYGGSFPPPGDAPAYGGSFPSVPEASTTPRDGDEPQVSAAGYPQRVPGAALSTGGALPPSASPDEPQGGSSVPQPRDPAKKPAVGSARPVTASASVPGVRVTPAEVAELPPPSGAAPQARIYGRPASPPPESAAEATGSSDEPSGGFAGSPYGQPQRGEDGGQVAPFAQGQPSGLPQRGENSSGGFAPAPTSPFGGPQQTDGQAGGFPPAPTSPFGGQWPRNDHPYGNPQQGDQFGAAPQQGDPFGRPSQASDPFGGPAQQGDNPPGGYPPAPTSPFGGSQQRGENPPGGSGLPQRGADDLGGGPPFPGPPEGGQQPGGYPPPPAAFGAAAPYPGTPRDEDRFQPPSGDGSGVPGGFGAPDAPGVAPQSPARATARATASARVTPPEAAPGGGAPFAMSGSPQFPGGDAQRGPAFPGAGDPGAPPPFPGNGPAVPGSPQFPGQVQFGDPFSEFTSNPGGRAPGQGGFPDQYNEHTTDVSGRGNSPYVPAPALPPMPGEQPGGGVYQHGPAARATVTPPGPEDTTSWPGPGDEQGKFDQFKADPPAPAAAPPGKTNVRTIPVALAVVLGAVLLLGLVFGIVYLISGDDFSVSQGGCVKREGSTPVVAACTEPDTYQVVSIVTAKEQCGDASQPYIMVPKKDGNQVLCLKKNG